MFNLFKSKPKTVVQYKTIDWSKVTTVSELTQILAACNFTVSVGESHWEQFSHLLKDSE